MYSNMKISKLIAIMLFFFTPLVFADDQTLNIYVWSSEIPDSVIAQFEKETHIKVNYATYDANETLYAKLLAARNPGYDIVQPSSYLITRMRDHNMLMKLDKTKIPNIKYLSNSVMHPGYDANRDYSLPGLWGVTGIFVNKQYYNPAKIHGWHDFWQPQYKNKLLLIDDLREVFSMSLLSLGLSANANNPEEIKKAYQHLLTLIPNIKLFANDAVPAIIADEDAVVGMAWNGDAFSAMQNNPNIIFIYPDDGFVVWSDDFVILQDAPHPLNAYRFLNFIERPDINAKIIQEEGYPTGNEAAKAYLPVAMKNSPVLFPPDSVMKRGIWQSDISDTALSVYNQFWTKLKLAN